MSRPIKKRSELDTIKRFLYRNAHQELRGQTQVKHYRATKDTMLFCALCGRAASEVKKLHRHRITPHGLYENENVFICCATCHKFIHSVYNRLKHADLTFPMKLTIAISEYKSK